MLREQGQRDSCKSACSKIHLNDEKDPSGLGRSQDHGHAIQERQRSVSVPTNQCLGKETNAEPPERGTEELRTRILPDGQQQIYSRDIGVTRLRLCRWLWLHYCIILMTAKDSNAFRQPVSSSRLNEFIQLYVGKLGTRR